MRLKRSEPPLKETETDPGIVYFPFFFLIYCQCWTNPKKTFGCSHTWPQGLSRMLSATELNRKHRRLDQKVQGRPTCDFVRAMSSQDNIALRMSHKMGPE